MTVYMVVCPVSCGRRTTDCLPSQIQDATFFLRNISSRFGCRDFVRLYQELSDGWRAKLVEKMLRSNYLAHQCAGLLCLSCKSDASRNDPDDNLNRSAV
jgi:hypothetical protein